VHAKFAVFLEVTAALNRLGVTPILYGSLGASRHTAIRAIEDVDIIIPDLWLGKRFPALKRCMARIGFRQDDTFPHEFTNGRYQIGFEPRSELRSDLGIRPKRLRTTEVNGSRFRELSLADYRRVYRNVLELQERKMSRTRSILAALERPKCRAAPSRTSALASTNESR